MPCRDTPLTYKGKAHKFRVNGLSVVDLGVAKVSANGEVFNLKKVSDFEGNYVAGEAGTAVGGGAGTAILKNQDGVVMKLTATGHRGQVHARRQGCRGQAQALAASVGTSKARASPGHWA